MSDFIPIPPTYAVQDAQTRAVLDALASNIVAAQENYATDEKVKTIAEQTVITVLGGGDIPGSSVGTLIENLSRAITGTELYNYLGTKIEPLVANSQWLSEFDERVRDLIESTQADANDLAAETAARVAAINQLTADLQAEANARIAAVQAEANARAQALLDEATARGAAIQVETQARQAADSSLSSQITTLTASVGANAAAIQTEATARANGDSAEATQRTILAARVTTNESSITNLNTVTQNQATSITNLTTRTSTAESNITTLQTTTANQATQISQLNSTVGNASRVFAQTTAPTSGGGYTLRTNDIWYDTDDGYKPYYWTGSAWADLTDTRLLNAGSNITSLQTTTANQASTLNSLSTRTSTAESNISNLQTTTTSQATSLTNLTTRVGTAESNISNLQTTTAGQATSITTLQTTVGQKARVFVQTTAPTSSASYTLQTNDLWYDTDDGLKSYRWNGTAWADLTDTRLLNAGSDITNLQQTTASQASSLTSLLTRTSTAETNITNLQTTTSTQGTSLTNLTTRVGTAETNIGTLQTTTSNQATQITNISATANAKNRTYYQTAAPTTGLVIGDIWIDTDDNRRLFRWNGTAWDAADDARTATNAAAITAEQTARINADNTLTTSISTQSSRITNAESAITTEQTTRNTKDLSLASAINNIWSVVGGSTAVIGDGSLAAATPTTAQATKWNQVTAAVTDPNTGQVSTTSIKQDFLTYASTNDTSVNGLKAQYTVKVDVNGYVSGFGLATTLNNGTPISDFAVRADRFSIASPGVNKVVPFIVSGGVTYISAAMIQNGTIDNAKIGNYIASTNFNGGINASGYISSAGTTGWAIDKSGYATFNNVKVRGDIQANSLTANTVYTENIVGAAVTISSIASGTFEAIITISVAAGTSGVAVLAGFGNGNYSSGKDFYNNVAIPGDIYMDGYGALVSGTGSAVYGFSNPGAGTYTLRARRLGTFPGWTFNSPVILIVQTFKR